MAHDNLTKDLIWRDLPEHNPQHLPKNEPRPLVAKHDIPKTCFSIVKPPRLTVSDPNIVQYPNVSAKENNTPIHPDMLPAGESDGRFTARVELTQVEDRSGWNLLEIVVLEQHFGDGIMKSSRILSVIMIGMDRKRESTVPTVPAEY